MNLFSSKLILQSRLPLPACRRRPWFHGLTLLSAALLSVMFVFSQTASAKIIPVDNFKAVGSPSPWDAPGTDNNDVSKDVLPGMDLTLILDNDPAGALNATTHGRPFVESVASVFGGSRTSSLVASVDDGSRGRQALLDLLPGVGELHYNADPHVNGTAKLSYLGLLDPSVANPLSSMVLTFRDFDFDGVDLTVGLQIDDGSAIPPVVFSVSKNLNHAVTSDEAFSLSLAGLGSSGVNLANPVALKFTFSYAGFEPRDYVVSNIEARTPGVPEPTTAVLAGTALTGLVVWGFRRRRLAALAA